MEFLRRLVVTLFVCTALWVFFYSPLFPLVRVKPVDFASDFKNETERPKRRSESLLPYNSSGSLNYEQFVALKTEGRIFQARGKAWEELFQGISAAYEGKGSAKELQKRVSSEYKEAGFFFYASEYPFNEIKDRLNKHLDVLYLAGSDGQYLKVDYRAYSHSDFNIGTGLTDYPKPPSWLIYPYRKYSLWIILTGIAFYILLPKKRKEKDSSHFKTRFIVGNDTCFVLLLIALPFIAPMAIMGGSVQIFFSEGIFLLPIFWLIALIGTWGFVWIMPRFACFEMKISDDGIRIGTTKGDKLYQFKEMEYFQWATFKRPRWIIIFAWIFVLAGRTGSINLLVLSTLTHTGIGIRLKDGTLFYIYTSNPMGQSVLNQPADEIAKLLHDKGVMEKEEEITIRTMGLEPVGTKGGYEMKKIIGSLALVSASVFGLSLLAYGNSITINFKSGRTVVYDQSEISSITFSETARPSLNIISGIKTFNGVSDALDVGTSLPPKMTGDLIIEMDVKPGASQQTHANIIDFNHRANEGLVIQQQGDDLNNFVFHIGNGNTVASITYRLQAGVWQNVVFQRQGTEIRLYINGRLVQTHPCFAGNIQYLPNSTVTVGYNKTYGRYFKGEIKDLRIK